jgi:2-oxoglutarate dehydrogenase complex dehydrogenase (E1) component-like enzyme
LGYTGRATCPAPATGIAKQHKQEKAKLFKDAFANLA